VKRASSPQLPDTKEVYNVPTLKNPVAYRSARLNMRVEVKGALSQTRDPDAMLHPDVKMAEFRDGVFSTSDPEIVEFLDKRTDVWRLDDPQSELRARFGPEEYARLRKQFASAQDETPTPAE
jgi:hypothetical protein